MVNQESLIELTHPKYWDERYRSGLNPDQDDSTKEKLDSYEWFRNFSQIRPFLEAKLPPSSSGCSILHLGCGNSTLTADLHALGYTNQANLDFSQVVIEAMHTKYAHLNAKWTVMDIRDMQIESGSVDVAIDKSTLDAFLHGSIWTPPDDVVESVGRYVDEVARVLKPGGIWLYITFRQPHFMKPLLERKEKWAVEVEVLVDPSGGGGFEYFGFTMKRYWGENVA